MTSHLIYFNDDKMVSIAKDVIRSDEQSSPAHRLLQAARSGHVAKVSAALSCASPPLAARDALTQSGRTLLHVAAHHGHLGVVLVALTQDSGVDVNVTNKVCWHLPRGDMRHCACSRVCVVRGDRVLHTAPEPLILRNTRGQ